MAVRDRNTDTNVAKVKASHLEAPQPIRMEDVDLEGDMVGIINGRLDEPAIVEMIRNRALPSQVQFYIRKMLWPLFEGIETSVVQGRGGESRGHFLRLAYTRAIVDALVRLDPELKASQPSAMAEGAQPVQTPSQGGDDRGSLSGATFSPPLSPEIEAREALKRAASLMAHDPAIVQELLPDVATVMQIVTESPDVMTRKEVAEEVGLSGDRVKVLTAQGRLGTLIGGQNLYSRKKAQEFKAIERRSGRPKSSS